ncbi:MAG: DUF1854 domain-containing protein [Alphaproteobacteria bacterium]|nr:DUF1854 domain-containing protein [Alphaproteobacteria bacterium]
MNAATVSHFDLYRDPYGVWMLRTADGEQHSRVTVVRPFPISAPSESVSVLSQDGRELLWIDRLADLPGPVQEIVIEALTQREFMPEILRLVNVSSYATPSVWHVETDRGVTDLVLKGEEDIRRLNAHTLIISDAHGVQYLICHLPSLDRLTRKQLDRFM